MTSREGDRSLFLGMPRAGPQRCPLGQPLLCARASLLSSSFFLSSLPFLISCSISVAATPPPSRGGRTRKSPVSSFDNDEAKKMWVHHVGNVEYRRKLRHPKRFFEVHSTMLYQDDFKPGMSSQPITDHFADQLRQIRLESQPHSIVP